MASETTQWLVRWLQNRNPGLAISPASRLYDEGLVDSFGIIELVEEAEKRFSVTFDDQDLRQNAFSTVGDFAGLIEKKVRKK